MKNLKNNIAFFLIGLSIIITGQSCKSELENRYWNPEQTAEANIPAFLTQVLNNSRLRSEYWHYRTFILMHHARYTQTAYFGNGNTMYQQNDSYTNDYWRDFYSPGIMGVYRAMERNLNELSDSEKASKQIFLNAARVIVYDQASKLVDNFGDIPFSEAGSLPSTDQISLAKFDNQQELYSTFISGLKELSSFFHNAQTTAEFTRADILNAGNVLKWEKYANSVRLRLLMRISNVDENSAKTEILEILNNPSQYPLIDGSNMGSYSPGIEDVLLQPLTTYTSSLLDALRELPSHYAPDYMVNTVLKPSNDPRIHVLFDKYGPTVNGQFVQNEDYNALAITVNATDANTEYSTNGPRRFAVVDSATTWINSKLPGIIMTSAEVNFIKAEAQERWGSTTEAKTAYETAIKQSINFYYHLNNTSSHAIKISKPNDAEINNFVSNSNIAYIGDATNKLKLIGTQKWLHFGWLQGEQAWSEYRRTGYPILPAFPVSSLNGFQNPPVRLIYPSSEVTNNSVNYESVRAKDTRATKIFWDVK
ncbi:SusD/RagB family nutrient-binding outer membrane lipoprotein [Sphingobacterium alkalisoli]|uniref:SusD/RagB family nutrient-binding outer membrane lipoprotein n=1 Tax=Sphingobacterium alkalisoli TaxID=1874115 RepID=A0A4V5LXX6_9SPHI|nr:SusD/RagB family nutrient-binding outer membrane lipoprotein [Sphingobacterium alkalisoli]TJY64329.1 SusD/RagB family nutrient-binding outer membrane lipoprotein [Sphingobacterium alkalisoli]GGH22398.1 hypothetical protein GCM10011418_28940 [Sphingobacterium alkalisoli]